MKRFFLGNNSGNGFFSYYSDELKNKNRVALLKGGPGTGKSTFMKQIVRECVSRGLGYEEWYCSGDPGSLDGVYINDINFVAVDATAPHALDPEFPVLKEEIINLADALDRSVLLDKRSSIENGINNKKAMFIRANQHLKCALCHYNNIFDLEKVSVLTSKINHFAYNFHSDLHHDGQSFADDLCAQPRRNVFNYAIAPDGEKVFYDCFRDKEIYLVKGSALAQKTFFDALGSVLAGGMFLHSALQPTDLEAVIVGNRALVSVSKHHENYMSCAGIYENSVSEVIDLSSFQNAYDEEQVNIEENACRLEIVLAEAELNKAREYHLGVEKYYVAAMDFDKLGEIKSKVLESIF